VNEVPVIKLNPPRLQERRAVLMAGLQEHYTPGTQNTIPAQWKRLPFGRIPGQLGRMAYGVVFNLDQKSGEFDYFCGVEVATISPTSPNLVEYYGENFDPESGTGDMEVWIPIQP
jgi:AraC family transcriptional regulator